MISLAIWCISAIVCLWVVLEVFKFFFPPNSEDQ